MDHFYLRSPKTGLAKLLTVGGFGIWWIWDWVQIWAEPERVKTYGLSAPFDFFHGIAQGMITDSTNYTPERDFGIWMIMNIFGFTGFALFYAGRYTQGMRMLIMFALAMYFFPYGGFFNAFHSIWGIVKFVFFVLFASGVVYHYCNTLYYMFSDDLMNTGIPLSNAGDRMMNSETKPGDEKESFIKKIYNFQSITGHDLSLKFWIKSQFEAIVENPDLKTKLMDTVYAPFFYWGWIVFEGAVLSIASVCIGVARLVIPGYLAAEKTAALVEKQIKLGEQQLDDTRLKMAKAVSGLQTQATGALAGLQGQATQATGALAGLQGQATQATGALAGAKAKQGSILDTLTKAASGAVQSVESSATAATAKAKATEASKHHDTKFSSLVGKHMRGGGDDHESVSSEGQILGATVMALVAGGGLKALIDYMVSE